MKRNSDNRKNHTTKGFTLVELIVVIAIIGVLAAILVPSMLGYVTKAKCSGANSSAKSLFSAAMTACRESDVNHPIPDGIYSTASNVGGRIVSDDKICKYIYEYFGAAETAYWAVDVVGDVPTATCIAKNAGDVYIGTYPNVNNKKQPSYTLEDAIAFAETGTGTGSWVN
jgi:type IV pilus assembly protein PilA